MQNRSIIFAGLAAGMVSLLLAAASCGPGDGCEVTRTCPVPTTGAGAAPSGGGGNGGTGAGTTTSAGGSDLAANGSPCGDAAECASTQCVDGVCCDSTCEGACVACNLDGFEGVCSPHAPATDPESECGMGVCDGVGECATGGHAWSQRFGDASDQFGNGIAAGPNGRSAIVGAYSGSPDFGSGALPSGGSSGDVFVAVFEENGDLAWVNAHDGNNQDSAQAVSFDTSGNVVVAGCYRSTNFSAGGSTLPSTSDREALLVKYNASGGHLWSRGFDGEYSQYAEESAIPRTRSLVGPRRSFGAHRPRYPSPEKEEPTSG